VWNNHGPASDFVWKKNESFTQANDVIIDTNGNQEGPYEAGYTAATQPTWKTALNALTLDNPNLSWVNRRSSTSSTNTNLLTVIRRQAGDMALRSLTRSITLFRTCLKFSAGTRAVYKCRVRSVASGLWSATYRTNRSAGRLCRHLPYDGRWSNAAIDSGSPATAIYTLPLNEYLKNGYQDTTPTQG